MKEIKLTRGYEAIVDDEDFEELSKHSWCIVFSKNRKEYAVRGLNRNKIKTLIYMHRQLMGVTDPKIEIDHKNGNGLDNRRENLRISNRSDNMANRQKMNSNNTSGYRGVYWNKRKSKWLSKIQHKSKQIFLGYFDDKEEAARAFDKKARELFGEFAGKLNDVEDL